MGGKEKGMSLLFPFRRGDTRTTSRPRKKEKKLPLLLSTHQRLLVPRRELCDVPEIHVGDPPISQSKNITRVRIPVEQPKLQKLPQPRDNAAADERVDVDARRDDGCRVGAAHPVNPLHRQHPLPTEIIAHPGDLDRGVAFEVAAEVLGVAGLQGVV